VEPSAGPIPVKKPSTEGLSQRSASVFTFYNLFFPSIPPGNKNQKKNCDTKCRHSVLRNAFQKREEEDEEKNNALL
jgi:hypothetical protein